MKRLLIYIAKCVAAVLIAFLLAKLFHYNDYIWCLISIILVLSPDAKDALPQASNRIKANLIGAAAGLIMLLFHVSPEITVSGAVIITIIVCHYTKLETPTRTALAATIIVTIHENGKYIWDTALERVIAVIAGCLIGIVITFIFHSRFINTSPETGMKADEG
ncbi:MAG TPA: FUSC family protein [Chitinophagaceae bacterium]|nr:FUSC family protein [Chitinophagaceae bacterium]